MTLGNLFNVPEEFQATKVDLSIRQELPGQALVVLHAPVPVAGAQIMIQFLGGSIYHIESLPGLDDFPIINVSAVSFGLYAAGNVRDPNGLGFLQGEIPFCRIYYRAKGQVSADFVRSGMFQSLVADPQGNDITGALQGTTLEPSA